MQTLDIVVPCYNEADSIHPLHQALTEALKQQQINWCVIYVNDGSKDDTLAEIKKLEDTYGAETVKYVSFSRNFGKEAAIFAGLSYSTAEYVVLMDADLQHPPTLLPQMIEALDEGYDCCGARRVSRRGEPLIRSVFSRMYYNFVNKVTSMQLTQGGSDFRMMRRHVIEAMLALPERERFTKGIMSWVGFQTKWIGYENVERSYGQTKWSMRNLVKYAVSGFISFATAPLRIAIWLGFTIDIVTLIAGIIFIIRTLSSDAPRTGYGTIVVLIAFFGGTIILLLGIIGEYLSRIYMEVKHRPIFIVKDTNIRHTPVIKEE